MKLICSEINYHPKKAKLFAYLFEIPVIGRIDLVLNFDGPFLKAVLEIVSLGK